MTFRSKNLTQHKLRNQNTKPINKSICHLLRTLFTYANAFSIISKNKDARTKSIEADANRNALFSVSNSHQMANSFIQKTYRFKPVRRVWIPKPGKKALRPIDTPTQRDRIVQEAIRGILDAIFEPKFRDFERYKQRLASNSGFRPSTSCYSALTTLKRKRPKNKPRYRQGY